MLSKKKFLLFLTVSLTICLGSYFRWLESFELIAFDWRMKLRSLQAVSPDIALIEISDDSIAQIGRWPFDRKFHAQLIKVLSEYGARQICFDVIFNKESASDDKLISATKNAGNVYYPFGRDVHLIGGLKEAVRGRGHINIVPDIDGKRRYIQPFVEIGKEIVPQLGILMAADYLGRQPKDLLLPLDERGRLIINYAGKWTEAFKHYSYVDILVSYDQKKIGLPQRINLSELKNKACFIGLTAVGTVDLSPTPMETVYPMLGVNANIFNSILNNSYLKRVNRGTNLLILFALLGFIIRLHKRSRLSFRWFLGLAVLLTGFFFISVVLFVAKGLWIDLIYPSAVLLCIAFFLLFQSYIKERERHLFLEHDLEIAAKLQQGFLKRSIIYRDAELEVAAQLRPCRYIGGDFYDVIKLDNGFTAVFIGDVAGKGVPASLYMALSISIFRAYIRLYRQPAKILQLVNQELKQRYPSGMFATAILLILDKQGKGAFANAGHITMIHKNGEKISSLDGGAGMPLGILDDCEYSEAGLELAANDTLVLYTDGILEAKKKAGGEEFGEARLTELIKKNDFLPAPVLAGRIVEGVSEFLHPAPSYDDLTVVVIKKNSVERRACSV
ncbi:MAG: CHASE2 domain-containing protein [Candidatus Omnitrophota bacterium]